MKKSRLFLLPILTMSLGVLSSCVEDDLSSLAVNLQSQIDELKNEVDGLKNQIATLRSDMEKADAAIKAEYDEKISSVNDRLTALNVQLDELTSSFNEAKQNIENDYNTKINNLKEYTDGKILELNNKNAELNQQIVELTDKINTEKQALKDDYNAKFDALTEALAVVRSDLQTSLNNAISDLEAELASDKQELTDDYNQKLAALSEADIAAREALKNDYDNKIAALEAKHDSDIADLEASYALKLAQLEENFNTSKTALENDYNSKIDALNQSFSEAKTSLQNQINANKTAMETFASNYLTEKAAMELDYNTKINNLRTTYEAKVVEIESSIAACNSSIETLEAEMNQKISDSQNDYNAKINELTARVATLEQITYHTVTFDTKGGSGISSQQVIHGEKATKPNNPVKPGCTFEGWTYLGEPWVFQGYVVTENMTITANWKNIDYTITFRNDDGTILEVQTPVHYGDSVTYTGATPIKPNPLEHYVYTFAGWDVDISNITGDTVATAQYNAEYAPYLVKYLDYDGSVLDSKYVLEGETITYTGDTPVREDDDENQLQFQFFGWDEIEKTENAITYKARYSSCTKGLVFSGNDVYQYTGSAKTVTVPSYWNGKAITNIGANSFAATDITSVVISEGVTSISDNAFHSCNSLVTVTLPNSIASIGTLNTSDSYYVDYYGAFEGCSSLKTINLPEGLEYIGYNCFTWCDSLQSIVLPESIVAISSKSFEGCLSLENINIPNGVENIGSYAFSSTSLSSVSIPDSVKTIGSWAFSGMDKLTDFTIGRGVTYISDYAFYNCKSLTDIIIPENVTALGNGIFNECSSLVIKVIRQFRPVDWLISWNNGNISVIWGYQNDVEINGYTYVLSNVNGNKTAMLTKVSSTIKNFNPAKNVGEYTLTALKPHILKGNNNIISIMLPDSIKSIENSFCEGCTNLRSVTLPDSVETIGDCAFKNCSSLASVKLSENITKLEYDTFMNCSQLKDIIVPNGVKRIENNCWNGCSSLKYVVLPNTIEQIGSRILSGCASLEHVYYVGTETEWGNVSVESTNDFQSKLTFINESEIPSSTSYWFERVNANLGSYAVSWNDEKEAYTYSENRELGKGETVKSVAADISDELLNVYNLNLQLLVSNVSDTKEAKYILYSVEGSIEILYSQYYGSTPTLFITVRLFDTTVDPVVNALGAVLGVNLQLVQEGVYGASGQFSFSSTYSLQQYGNAILRSYIATDLIACTALGFTLKSSGMNGNDYVGQFQNSDGYAVKITLLGDADKNYSNYYQVLVVLPDNG